MTFRADKFDFHAADADIQVIQGEAQRYADDMDKMENTANKGNRILHLYLQIAYDEGYRSVMEELKLDSLSGKNVEILPRKKGLFEYIEDESTISKIIPLLKRRIKSKRQRKEFKKHGEENGREFCEEMFMLSMVIHTGFEQGYAKADSLEETAKIICKNQESADMVMELFKELFPKEMR